MARDDLTAPQLRDALKYDPQTGFFFWRKGARENKTAGGIGKFGYHRITIGSTTYLAHRLAWLFVHGDWPKYCIDHRDGNPKNNAISNLRDVSHAANAQNRWRARSGNACGLLGAHWSKSTSAWIAQIRSNGRIIHIGSFKTAEDAHKAYIEAKIKLHGLP